MIDRAEVEELLAKLTPREELLRELCRTWLAVADAPEGTIDACDFKTYDRPAWIVVDDRERVPLNEPKRIRLVPTSEKGVE